MMTSKDLEIVAKLAFAYLYNADAEKEGWVGGRDECSDAFERVMIEVHRLERLTNEAGDNEPNESINDIAIKEANKAMDKTNRVTDWIYAGREVALIVGGVVLFGTISYLMFSVL